MRVKQAKMVLMPAEEVTVEISTEGCRSPRLPSPILISHATSHRSGKRSPPSRNRSSRVGTIPTALAARERRLLARIRAVSAFSGEWCGMDRAIGGISARRGAAVAYIWRVRCINRRVLAELSH